MNFLKNLFAVFILLFSVSLASKELNYHFIKDLSARLDNACDLQKKGNSVKSEDALKKISKDIDGYFSKNKEFELSKDCPIVWEKGTYEAHLQCMPHISFSWAFGDTISKTILSQMEDFGEKNQRILINGKLSSLYKFKKYHSIGVSDSCFDLDTFQRIPIYAVPKSVSKGSKDWSTYQGYMTWTEGKNQCDSIGMRLPTIEELLVAPLNDWEKDPAAEEPGYNDNRRYWSSKESGQNAFRVDPWYWKNIGHENDKGEPKDLRGKIRCIKGLDFPMKSD